MRVREKLRLREPSAVKVRVGDIDLEKEALRDPEGLGDTLEVADGDREVVADVEKVRVGLGEPLPVPDALRDPVNESLEEGEGERLQVGVVVSAAEKVPD